MKKIIVVCAALGLGFLGIAGGEMSVPAAEGCQQVDLSSGCTSAPAMIPVDVPQWQIDLKTVQRSNAECQADIEKFCEGVQVGEGRIEACLKKNQKKLSKKCRTAQKL